MLIHRAHRVWQGCHSPEEGQDKLELSGFAGLCGRTLGSIFQHSDYISSGQGFESVFQFQTRSCSCEFCLANNSGGRTYQNLCSIWGTVWRPEWMWMNSLCFVEYLYSTPVLSQEKKIDIEQEDAKVDYYIRVSTWGQLRDNKIILVCVCVCIGIRNFLSGIYYI